MSGAASSEGITVYYDGACPLCRREIGYYRRQRGAEGIEWRDVSATEGGEVATDLPRAKALARFHVRLPDGSLASGGRAFAELWAALPRFRRLGVVGLSRPMRPLLELAYRAFLTLRPGFQRAAAALEGSGYPRWLARELRSDHAGEAGAVAIYHGVLATSRDPHVRDFARRHIATERRHLRAMRELVPVVQRSKLLPVWYVAGFLTGALPGLVGARAVYGTIREVETFVDGHYLQQIERLREDGSFRELRATLEAFRDDEIAHRDEAAAHKAPEGKLMQAWLRAVARGSDIGVAIARRI